MIVHRRRDGALTRELLREPGRFGLGQVPARMAPDAAVSMVCGFCSTGCSLDVHVRAGQAVNITPTTDYPVNLGMACPKGWESLAPLRASDRATTPLWSDARGRRHPIGWSAAIATFVQRFRAVMDEHGPEAVAFLSTGQIPTEEMLLLGALAKFGMGMVHGDANTRQCMATSVVAYKESLGFDAPPFTYADLEESDVIVLVGSNLCIAHPILWERICRNRHQPEIVVVDPRATETAMAATQHYALAPKSDLALLYGVAHVLIDRGWIDGEYVAAHTEGYGDFADHVRDYPPERVATLTGISADDVVRLAATIHRGKRVSFWWTMGVNQSHEGTRTAQAIVNLALLTGNMGRPGTGANSVTGQCNAMGSRLFATTSSLPCGRSFTSADDRAEVAQILDIDEARIPHHAGMAYDEIIDAVAAGRIKALWVVATNTAHSWIDRRHLEPALDRLEFLVVQDMYATSETARRADLVLPAAGWAEKDGTFINSERRIGLVKRVAEAPGSALSDFAIFKLIAEEWGCGDLFESWTSPEATFETMQELARGRPCDFSGIDGYDAVERARGIQWPYPAVGADPAPERRLFEDGRFFHPDGRARFVFEAPRPMREAVSDEYPLFLLTGRGSSAQWHTETRTGKSAVLRSLSSPEPYVELTPEDASTRSIRPHDWVTVSSARGSMRARAVVTSTVGRGRVFVPMHYAAVNELTVSEFDPYSRQPSYKVGAVEVRRARTPWR